VRDNRHVIPRLYSYFQNVKIKDLLPKSTIEAKTLCINKYGVDLACTSRYDRGHDDQ